MDFVKVILVFGVLGFGFLLVFQGIIGKDPPSEAGAGARWIRDNSDGPRVQPILHPPEKHPVRLILIGVGVMVLAVCLGLVVW